LNTGLSLKANIQDVSKTVADIAACLDTKLDAVDQQSLCQDYVLKTDL